MGLASVLFARLQRLKFLVLRRQQAFASAEEEAIPGDHSSQHTEPHDVRIRSGESISDYPQGHHLQTYHPRR